MSYVKRNSKDNEDIEKWLLSEHHICFSILVGVLNKITRSACKLCSAALIKTHSCPVTKTVQTDHIWSILGHSFHRSVIQCNHKVIPDTPEWKSVFVLAVFWTLIDHHFTVYDNQKEIDTDNN